MNQGPAKEQQEKDQEKEFVIDKAIVCPNCADRIGSATILPERTDRYGRLIRGYVGWCCNCHRGLEVLQFKSADKWYIHKYRYWLTVTETPGSNIPFEWRELNPLPDAPPVVTGPGGDYDKSIMIHAVDTLKRIDNITQTLSETIKSLVKAINLSGKK
jgi:hypothetical protein